MERSGGIGDWIADGDTEHGVYPAATSRPRENDASLPSMPIERADHEPIERALQESEERYRYTIALSPLVAWTADAIGGILEVDDRGLELTGISFENARGRGFFKAVHPDDRSRMAAMWRQNATLGHPIDNDVRMRLADGSYRWHRSRAAPRRDTSGKILRWYGTIEDIHDRKLAADAIRWAAEHDGLTGVWNRGAFYKGLEVAIASAAAEGSDVALLLFDLDNFKQVNDQFGHDIGDALLRDVALRLTGAAEEPMMAGRLGGDEFALFLARPDPQQLAMSAKQAIAAFERPFRHGEITYYCRSSIGLALYPAHGAEGETLRKNADLALYDAKVAGGGAVRTFRSELRLNMQARLSMLSVARHALERDRIIPFYQPKFDLRTDRVTGFEALLRWSHPGHGLQFPGAIAAAFDDPELAVAIGERMHERVIADIQVWLKSGLAFGQIAINASAAEFRSPDFAARLLERLARANVPASCIELEVTECVFLSHDAGHVRRIIAALSEAGVSIALDDFGTGFASLAHLKQFHVDVLKIDRSFVSQLPDDCDGAIVRAIVGLGRSLGITTVAEGIETIAQRDQLLADGCDLGQGFLFSKAVPAADVPRLLQSQDVAYPPRDRRSGRGRRLRDGT
jgi:diguanylate cyclase (GGDEF)-like protein/PAS domain S-box-containing protein